MQQLPTPRSIRFDETLVLDGLTPIEEVGELLGVPLQRSESVRTLGGLVFLLMNRIPEAGDSVNVGGFLLEVETMEGRRVASVRVRATVEHSYVKIGGALSLPRSMTLRTAG